MDLSVAVSQLVVRSCLGMISRLRDRKEEKAFEMMVVGPGGISSQI